MLAEIVFHSLQLQDGATAANIPNLAQATIVARATS